MALTRDQVLRVTHLASLELTDEEADEMCQQLGAVLDYMRELERVDVSGVEPTAHTLGARPPLREDVVVASQPRELYLRAAPESDEGAFAVPKVLDGEG